VWVIDAVSPVPAPAGDWLAVSNKCDLAPRDGGLRVSARTGEGLAALKAELARRIRGGEARAGEVVITHRRHAELLAEASRAFAKACENARGAPLEIVAYDLAEGARALDRIRGRGVDDAVLDAVFARFCIGK
jgi:tRNA modification GTPase